MKPVRLFFEKCFSGTGLKREISSGVILAYLLFIFAVPLTAAQLPVSPGIKTEEKKIAEGIYFRSEVDPAGPWKIYMIIMDKNLAGRNFCIESIPGCSMSAGRESVPDIWKRIKSKKKPIAAVNGDAFEMGGRTPQRTGEPLSICVSNGEFISSGFGSSDLVLVSFPRNGGLDIAPHKFEGKVTAGDKSWQITRYNHIEAKGDYSKVNAVHGYNCLCGNWKLPADGIIVKLDKKTVTLPFKCNATVIGKVEKGSTLSGISANEMVLSGFGNAAGFNEIPKRTKLKIEFSVREKLDEPLYNVCGGFWQFRRDGKALLNDRKVRHPRTIVAADQKKLVFIVVDGRQKNSIGMSSAEMNAMLERLQLTEGVNLDGGGSSTMMIKGKVVNEPSDGVPRAVGSTLFIFK